MVIISILLIVAMIFGLLMNFQAKKLSINKVKCNCDIKIVQISDLHFDMLLVSPTKIINEISKICPDIIVITGDLCSKLKYFERVLNFLDMLSYKCNCEILITLGNHDNRIFNEKKCTKEEYISSLESVSKRIHVLENETYIYKDILFGGLGDIKNNEEDYSKLVLRWNQKAKNEKKLLILLTHNPDISINIPYLDNLKIMLTGHTHGGQIQVPFNIEFRLLKKDILPKKRIFYGKHVVNKNNIYISSGIGCTFLPMRLKSTAEIVIFE